MASSESRADALGHPARSIGELEQRSQGTGPAYGFSLWKLLLGFNALGFAFGVTRYLWGQKLGDAIVIIVTLGALAPMAILFYQSTVFLLDRWMPRKFSSPAQDILDSDASETPMKNDSTEI